MGSKRPERRISSTDKLLNQLKPEMLMEFYNPLRTEQPIRKGCLKANQKKSLKDVDFWTDSEDEFKSELENAVKQYKKNIIKNKPVQMEAKLSSKETQYEVKESPNNNTYDNINYYRKGKNKKRIGSEVSTNGSASNDVLELISYFFLNNQNNKREKSTVKSYADYEKQGAIPKYKFVREDSSDRRKNTEAGSKSNRNDRENNQEVAEDFIEYKKKSDCFKVNEEFCSRTFYYIVPENPRPNFFLSPGSYFVIPKSRSSLSKSRVFVHPEDQTERHLSSSEVESDTGIPTPRHSRLPKNNLGKEVLQKLDSHLNIGPTDVKWNDSCYNLETNHESNKTFNKSVLNSPDALKRQGEGISEKNILWLDDPEVAFSEQSEMENLCGEIPEAEALQLQELDKTLQTLLTELPNLDANSAKIIADKYVADEEGLKNYIASAQLKQKIQQQLERMVLSLPENDYDELRDKCNEFQGEEELVSQFILEAQQANKIRQQILDLQFVLPDADPEFLRQEIEKLNGDENAFNTLTDTLLDKNDYPKILEDPLRTERRKWWQVYVVNFNVKNFLLKVSNRDYFAGSASNDKEKDEELKIKFLKSRYPTKTRNFLVEALYSNNHNLKDTCASLKGEELVRLSQSSFQNEAFTEAFLEQICYIDHEQEIEEYLKEEKEWKEVEAEEARLNGSFLQCPLCADDELIVSDAICCLDGHIFCKDCIKRYIFVKIADGVFKFTCPLEGCDTCFSYKTLQEILPENVLSNVINKQQAEEISTADVDGLESCPYCEFAYIPNPEDKIFKCQNVACLIETCRNCGEKNHIPLRCEEIERSVDVEARKKIEESMTQKLVRTCPKCQRKFVKIDGCNKMVCVCGTVVCYICRKEVSGYEHFSHIAGERGCPLHTNNEDLHVREVFEAGIQARDEILRENQNIRLLHDPTIK